MNDREHARTAHRIARAWLRRIEAIAPDDANAQRHAAINRFAVKDRLSVIASGMLDRVFGDAIAAVHDSIGWLNHEQRTPEEWRRGVAIIADGVAILADLIGDEPPATMGPAPAGDDAQPSEAAPADVGSLPDSQRRAWVSFCEARAASNDPDTDAPAREHYAWLVEHGSDAYGGPPDVEWDTWARYVRGARKRLAGPKNTPRAGRTGRSIVRSDQV